MGLLFLLFLVFLLIYYLMKNIPRVDLNNFLSNEPTRKNAFVKSLGQAFEKIGFVILKGLFKQG